MFVVLHRWKLHTGHEKQFIEAWSAMTSGIQQWVPGASTAEPTDPSHLGNSVWIGVLQAPQIHTIVRVRPGRLLGQILAMSVLRQRLCSRS